MELLGLGFFIALEDGWQRPWGLEVWKCDEDQQAGWKRDVSRRRESREGIDDENIANPCPCLHIFAVEHMATGCARCLHDQRIPE